MNVTKKKKARGKNAYRIQKPKNILLKRILCFTLVLFSICSFLGPWVGGIHYANSISDLCETLITAFVALSAIFIKLNIKKRNICFKSLAVLILLLTNAHIAFAWHQTNIDREEAKKNSPLEVSTQNSNNISSESDFPNDIVIDWENDIYLIDFMSRTSDIYQINEEKITDLFFRYANKFVNRDEVRPTRSDSESLQEGQYGHYIAKALSFSKDRSKVHNDIIKNECITEEIKYRKEALNIAEEADNIKEIANLYLEQYEMKSFNTTPIQCLEEGLRFAIKSLTFAYCDGYKADYIEEIWKLIRKFYDEISKISTIDNGVRKQANFISECLSKEFIYK